MYILLTMVPIQKANKSMPILKIKSNSSICIGPLGDSFHNAICVITEVDMIKTIGVLVLKTRKKIIRTMG